MNSKIKINKARGFLVLDHPFFGNLILRLKITESKQFPTAVTDGERLLYNPDYVDNLTIDQTIGLLAHEVMHCALGHFWRQLGREAKKWNRACDYAINPRVLGDKMELPKGRLLNSDFDDMTEEEIYLVLPDEQKRGGDSQGQQTQQGQGQGQSGQQGQSQPSQDKDKPKQGQDQGQSKQNKDQTDIDPGGCGAVIPTPAKKSNKGKMDKLANEWKGAVASAMKVAKSIGKMSGDLQRTIEKVINPPLPWYSLLEDFLVRQSMNDYCWTRPNPQYLYRGIVMPTVTGEELPEVIVIIDTSGSITKNQLSVFAFQTSAILSTFNTKARVIYCDTKVHEQEEEVFTRANLPLKFKPVGGGGTRFAPAFNYIEQKGYQPTCVIYFTDLAASDIRDIQEPPYPVLWVVPRTDRQPKFTKTAPFGKQTPMRMSA